MMPPPVDNKKCILESFKYSNFEIPAGSKLVEMLIEERYDSNQLRTCVFGIYRSPLEWHQEASRLPHPAENKSFLKQWQQHGLLETLSHSRSEIAAHRVRTIKRIEARRIELAEQEEALHDEIPMTSGASCMTRTSSCC